MIRLPPYGLCLPCWLHRVRDGDTIEVRIFSGLVWAVRLVDCWCPEPRGPDRVRGLAAKQYAQDAIEAADQLSVFIPPPEHLAAVMDRMGVERHSQAINMLQMLTFDRLPGYIFLRTDLTLNDHLINSGHATRCRP